LFDRSFAQPGPDFVFVKLDKNTLTPDLDRRQPVGQLPAQGRNGFDFIIRARLGQFAGSRRGKPDGLTSRICSTKPY
jgi:hypothetical protein